MVKDPAPSNGRKVAIIGAGPSGLTIAVILARYGYDVTIFDSKDKIGGVMRYGIPDFRLPDAALDDFAYRHLELKGIKFRPNTTIGGAIGLDDLFRDGYQSIFVGAGLWRPKALHIKGETLGHVAFAINYRASPKAFRLGKRMAEAMHAYMQSLPLPEPSPYANAPTVEPIEGSVLAEQILGEK